MPISPQKAHERARKAGLARSSPDYHIRSLERAELTADQRWRLIRLVWSFLEAPGAEPAGGAEAGDAA